MGRVVLKILSVLGVLLALGGPERGTPSPRAIAILPSGRQVFLEVASDPIARQRGLMFRERLDPSTGMLFVFEESRRHAFWMKNCRISLDIVWLDDRFVVVDVAPELPPCPVDGPCPERIPMRPARYVLELAAGTARAEGVRLGEKLVLFGDGISR